jgi:hypothetical protein
MELKMKTQIRYVVRSKGTKWRQTFKTLDEAYEYAKTDVFMTKLNDVVIEKVITETIWVKEKI